MAQSISASHFAGLHALQSAAGETFHAGIALKRSAHGSVRQRLFGCAGQRSVGLKEKVSYFVVNVLTFFRPASLNCCSTAGASVGSALYTTTLRPASIASL